MAKNRNRTKGGAVGGATGGAGGGGAAKAPPKTNAAGAPKPVKPKIDKDWNRPRKQRVRERYRDKVADWRAAPAPGDGDPGADPGGGYDEDWGGEWGGGGGGAYEDTDASNTGATEDPRAYYDYILTKAGANPYTGYGFGTFLDDEFMNMEANYNFLSQHVNPELNFKDYLSTLGLSQEGAQPGVDSLRRRYLSRPAALYGYDDPRAGGLRWQVYG